MTYEGSQRLGDLFRNRREKGMPGLPTLSVTMNNGLVNRGSLGRKSDTSLGDAEHLLVRKGDIAYNTMRMWQGAFGLADKEGLISPAYIVLAPKARTDSLYASHLFKSQRMIHLFRAYSYGLTSDRLRLYFDDFAKIPVTVPSAKEQAKIALILSTWDKAIEVTEALLANSELKRKHLIQRLLKRPSKSGTLTTLGTLATFRSGGTPSKQNTEFWGGPHAWISAKDLKSHYIESSIETLSAAGLEAAKTAPKGSSLVLVRGMTLLNDFPVGFSIKDVAFNQDVKALVPNKGVDPLFLSYLLVAYKEEIRDLVSVAGHGTGKLETDQLRAFEVSIPSLVEQREIAKAIDAWSNVIESNVRQSQLLRGEKRALMQQLLTGKRRVKLAPSD